MAILGNVFVLYVLSGVLGLITLIILYFKHQYSYWKKRNVAHIPATIPFGNFSRFFQQKCSIGEQMTEIYNQLKKTGQKYCGIYIIAQPILLVLDPELAKSIMTKDYLYFNSRGIYSDEDNDPLTGHLLNLSGSKWKFMRSKLTPTFTSSKIKMMFQTVVNCSKELEATLEEYSKNKTPLDVKDTMGRFTTDVIGSCAFGIACNSLNEPENEFRKHGKRLFEPTYLDNLKTLISNQFPKIFAGLHIKTFPKEVNEFFMRIVKDTVRYRVNNKVNRNDFIQLLIQLMEGRVMDDSEEKDQNKIKLSVNQVAAQAFVFFLAGFETSATALASFMYEMCKHLDVQEEIREEIHQTLAKYNGKLTYEGIIEMTYLEKAINETIRLHAVTPWVSRQCTEDYKVPDNDLVIKKGMNVFIPCSGFHMDPEYFPQSEEFDTERFSPEEQSKRHPYAFLGFGAGPRNCIGVRFGMMQMKVGIVALLKNYRFTLNSKTQLPIKQDPRCSLYSIQGSIWVNAERI